MFSFEDIKNFYLWQLNARVFNSLILFQFVKTHPVLIGLRNQQGFTLVEIAIFHHLIAPLVDLKNNGCTVVPDLKFTRHVLKNPVFWNAYWHLIEAGCFTVDHIFSDDNNTQMTLKDILLENPTLPHSIHQWLKAKKARTVLELEEKIFSSHRESYPLTYLFQETPYPSQFTESDAEAQQTEAIAAYKASIIKTLDL